MHICSEKPQEEGGPSGNAQFSDSLCLIIPRTHRTLEHVFCVVKVVSPSGSHLLSSMTPATLTAMVGSM